MAHRIWVNCVVSDLIILIIETHVETLLKTQKL